MRLKRKFSFITILKRLNILTISKLKYIYDFTKIMIAIAALLFSTSCVVIRPGEVGVKQKLGTLSKEYKTQGSVWYNPFIIRVIITNIPIKT